MRNFRLLAFLSAAALLGGCAYRAAVMSGFDFTAIKKVGVLSFTPAGLIENQSAGEAVSDRFIMQFLSMGMTVVERQRIEDILREQRFGSALQKESMRSLNEKLGVDVLVTGTILKYVPDKKNYVLVGNVQDPNADLRTRIVMTNAEVGISARMIDLKTGNIIWAGTYSYESYSLDDAIAGAVSFILSGLGPRLGPGEIN